MLTEAITVIPLASGIVVNVVNGKGELAARLRVYPDGKVEPLSLVGFPQYPVMRMIHITSEGRVALTRGVP